MGGVVGLGSALVIKWVIFDFLLKLGVPLFQGIICGFAYLLIVCSSTSRFGV